jgi:hypothetical protein
MKITISKMRNQRTINLHAQRNSGSFSIRILASIIEQNSRRIKSGNSINYKSSEKSDMLAWNVQGT